MRRCVVVFLGWASVSAFSANWQKRIEGVVEGQAAVDDAKGLVYAGSTDANVYCWSADTGEQQWVFRTGGKVTGGVTLGSDGTLYFGSRDSYVYAVDSAGTELWKYKTDGPVQAQPRVAKDIRGVDTVFIGSNDGNLHAIYSVDGSRKCTHATDEPVWSRPAVSSDGATVYFGGNDDHLHAVKATDCTAVWKYNLNGDGISGPVVANTTVGGAQTVYAGSFDGNLYALHAATGAHQWTFAANAGIQSSPAVSADGTTVYFGSYDYHLYSVDAASGAQRWKFNAGGYVASSPVVHRTGGHDDTIVFSSSGGRVHSTAVSADGKVVHARQPTEFNTVGVAGVTYVHQQPPHHHHRRLNHPSTARFCLLTHPTHSPHATAQLPYGDRHLPTHERQLRQCGARV